MPKPFPKHLTITLLNFENLYEKMNTVITVEFLDLRGIPEFPLLCANVPLILLNSLRNIPSLLLHLGNMFMQARSHEFKTKSHVALTAWGMASLCLVLWLSYENRINAVLSFVTSPLFRKWISTHIVEIVMALPSKSFT